MLKKIPKILTSDLIKVLMDMGHGNEICIANANFPAVDYAKRIVNGGTDSIPKLLESVLEYMPLDIVVESPVFLMEPLEPNWSNPQIWGEYSTIINKSSEAKAFHDFLLLERFEFYERAKACFAIVLTNEQTIYSNVILKKGVIL